MEEYLQKFEGNISKISFQSYTARPPTPLLESCVVSLVVVNLQHERDFIPLVAKQGTERDKAPCLF